MRVAVVTDSTSGLPRELAAQWGITVVPMRIRMRGRIDDEYRVPRGDLIAALRAAEPVGTEPPDPATFDWAYRTAATNGADAVVSVHISGKHSTTLLQAQEGARRSGVPVRVVDSGTFGMSLGYAVTGAARVAGAGGDPLRVLGSLERRLGGSSSLIYVESIDHLRRGGRVNAVVALLGGALSLKPLLTVEEGTLVPLDRVMGRARALRRLVDLAVQRAGTERVDIAVEHVDAPDRAAEVLAELGSRVPNVRERIVLDSASATAVHFGPGTIAIFISPA